MGWDEMGRDGSGGKGRQEGEDGWVDGKQKGRDESGGTCFGHRDKMTLLSVIKQEGQAG